MVLHTAYYLMKYGFAHRVALVVWLNLPFLAVMWLAQPYSDLFWYPYWWLNLQTAWCVYSFFEDGLNLLVQKVIWIDIYVILLTAYLSDFVLTDADIKKCRATKQLHDEIWRVLHDDEALRRGTPRFLGFGEMHTGLFFNILTKVIDEPERFNADRVRKAQRLAMLFSLPMSFFPMLKWRLLFWSIVAGVYMLVLLIVCVWNACSANQYKKQFDREIEKMRADMNI